MRDAQPDRAGTAAQIEHAGACRALHAPERRLDQSLGILTRNERAPVAAKRQPHKAGVAQYVLERLAGYAPIKPPVQPRLRVPGQRVAPMKAQLCA